MKEHDLERVVEVCEQALARPSALRTAFLDEVCAGDIEVRRAVEALLAEQSAGSGIIEHWPWRPEPARLPAGARLGPYEILALIGAGGMGEVYKARDTKLNRHVALKTLPDAVAADPDRLARFEREAQVLAALNHPNIAAVYAVEDRAIVMELVAGEDLSVRLQRGPIPLAEALPLARQIADAVAAAHEAGIIHRDLKPANIKVKDDGTVKVLDFGLAKALEPPGERSIEAMNSPTLSARATRMGVILGTAAYMAPEQARGKPVDKRADIWAFGVVLYEMLVGTRPFVGDDVTTVLAAIVRGEPDWNALPATTPAPVRRLLVRCLTKDTKQRLHDIADARLEIEDALTGAAAPPATVPVIAPRRIREWVAWTLLVLAVLALGALTAPTTLYFRRIALQPIVTRLDVVTPSTSDPFSFALSPDGRRLAFVATVEGGPRLWLRPLDQGTAQPLAGTEGASHPFWAPDSRSLGFFADGQLKRLQLGGGKPQVLAEARNPMGGAWNQDGDIIFAPFAASPLVRVAARGGTPTAVTRLATGERSHRFPAFLPDGRRFLFLVGLSGSEADGVYLASLDAPEMRQRLLPDDSAAAYAAPGYLLIVRQGVLMAAPFDATRGTLLGEPTEVAPGVGSNDLDGREAFSVSEAGVLAYRTGGMVRPSGQLTWINRNGRVTGTLSSSGFPGLTSDGQHAAVAVRIQGNYDISLIDTTHGVPKRFTFDPAIDIFPVWSPDGSRLIFSSNRKGPFDLFEKATSLAHDEQVLLSSADNKFPVDWSPDGRVLLYVTQDQATGDHLWALPLEGTPTPARVTQTRFSEDQGQFSPDGRWIVYRSNENGPRDIFLRPFPGPGSQNQVSTGGGSQPRWRRDGKELYYIAADNRLMAVPIHLPSANGTPDVGVPLALFATRLAAPSNAQYGYAVAPDGRFLMNVVGDESSAVPITIVLNWTAGLKK